MSWQAHKDAISLAHSRAGELRDLLLAASEKADEVMDAVTAATGDDPQQQSAYGAHALTSVIRETISTMAGSCATIQNHLNDYNDHV